jgi:hypothetical protein
MVLQTSNAQLNRKVDKLIKLDSKLMITNVRLTAKVNELQNANVQLTAEVHKLKTSNTELSTLLRHVSNHHFTSIYTA